MSTLNKNLPGQAIAKTSRAAMGYPNIMARNRKSRSSAKSSPRENQIRIIGGTWRGRKIGFPGIDGLRPTGDRIRETVFNWLMSEVVNANVVDLCAGSGALGFEALSRGACQVCFVDPHSQVCQTIAKNIELLDAKNALIEQQSAQDFVLAAQAQSADIIFLDPPFADNLHEELVSLIYAQQLIKNNGYLYIESPIHSSISLPAGWIRHREKTSGQVRYMLVRCQ